jgi:hypothetical protein
MVSGMELARLFYRDAVGPIIHDVVGADHGAGMLDAGSEVIGFDDETSRDHSWGPRLQIFLPEAVSQDLADQLDNALRDRLPAAFQGLSTHFQDSDDGGSRLRAISEGGPVDHYVVLTKTSNFLLKYIGIDTVDNLSDADWLSLPSQKLLTLSTGPIFHDNIGLVALQQHLRFYPADAWLYLMACEWMRIDQEEPFLGRTGMVGDEIGSRIITARLIQHIMRLAFLTERRYPPYSKWFGTAFTQLDSAETLTPLIERTLAAAAWKDREDAFVNLVGALGEMHNGLNLTEYIDPSPRQFHSRPIRVVGCERFASALRAASTKPESPHWTRRPIGGIDTFSDSTDLLSDTDRRFRIASLFD